MMYENFKKPPIVYKGKKSLVKQILCVMPCTWKHKCCEGTDEAHYTTGSHAGANVKNDKKTLPLCRAHHTIQGQYGERKFWGDKLAEADKLSDTLHISYLEGMLYGTDALKEMNEACDKFR